MQRTVGKAASVNMLIRKLPVLLRCCSGLVLLGFAAGILPLSSSGQTNSSQELFSLPAKTIKDVLDSARKLPGPQGVKIQGHVTLYSPATGGLFVQDQTAGIFAEGVTNSSIRVGDLVELIGTTSRTGFSPTLIRCACRVLGPGQPPAPQTATGPELKRGLLDMRLVRLKGPLVEGSTANSDSQFLHMTVDGVVVTLSLETTSGSPLSQLKPGSLLQATGVCSIGGDSQHRPVIFRVHLRSGDDVVVLRGPPWWTAQKVAFLLALLAAGALAALGWMASLRHKTLSRALEQQVQQRTAELEVANRDLQAANRDLESFSYSVSHDLRAPLRAIAGFTDALLEDDDGRLEQRQQDYLGRIQRAAAQMNGLIDGLLTLGRATRGPLQCQDIDLSAVARSVLDEIRQSDPQRHVTVTVQEGMLDSADPNLVRVVFANLVQNAWKFTAKTGHPHIEVSRSAQDKTWVYVVRDNGAGFDPVQAERLFQPFQRLHSSAEYRGTGIGLATVQRIVRRHGGSVWAKGQPDGGAAFFFTLQAEVAPYPERFQC